MSDIQVGDDITPDDYEAELAALDLRADALEAGWSDYTPTFYLNLNALTAGDATIDGRYRLSGGTVHFSFELEWGTTTAWPANGTLNVTLPLPARHGSVDGKPIAGMACVFDTDVADPYMAALTIGVTDHRVVLRNMNDSSVFDGDTPIAVWAAGDRIMGEGSYEAG